MSPPLAALALPVLCACLFLPGQILAQAGEQQQAAAASDKPAVVSLRCAGEMKETLKGQEPKIYRIERVYELSADGFIEHIGAETFKYDSKEIEKKEDSDNLRHSGRYRLDPLQIIFDEQTEHRQAKTINTRYFLINRQNGKWTGIEWHKGGSLAAMGEDMTKMLSINGSCEPLSAAR